MIAKELAQAVEVDLMVVLVQETQEECLILLLTATLATSVTNIFKASKSRLPRAQSQTAPEEEPKETSAEAILHHRTKIMRI